MAKVRSLVFTLEVALPLDGLVDDLLRKTKESVEARGGSVDLVDVSQQDAQRSAPTRSGKARGKLTPEKMADAKRRLSKGNESQAAIAKALGVSRSSIAHIAQGRHSSQRGPKKATPSKAKAPEVAA